LNHLDVRSTGAAPELDTITPYWTESLFIQEKFVICGQLRVQTVDVRGKLVSLRIPETGAWAGSRVRAMRRREPIPASGNSKPCLPV
jgi:hypothetical protein